MARLLWIRLMPLPPRLRACADVRAVLEEDTYHLRVTLCRSPHEGRLGAGGPAVGVGSRREELPHHLGAPRPGRGHQHGLTLEQRRFGIGTRLQ